MTQDEEHLRLLSIFHYVVGGIVALFALFPVIHLIFGILFTFSPDTFDHSGDAPPAIIGLLFIILPALFILTGWIFAVLVILSGRFLAQRKHYLFCLVMAGMLCLFMPFGTVLGVFTIIVLTKDPVKALFTQNKAGLQESFR